MSDLRNLLLDCRAALRRADSTFDDGPLRPRLDKTIITMSTSGATRSEAAEPPSFTAQQVAYAWQQVARELHFTYPALYAELGERVRGRLGGAVADPATELLELQVQLGAVQSDQAMLQGELSTLRAALADAIALEGADARGSAGECALRRVQRLVECASRGGGVPKPRRQDAAGPCPTRAHLQQVANGTAVFDGAQREWCIGEAVARTAFERTPEQLLAGGDRALASLLLDDPQIA